MVGLGWVYGMMGDLDGTLSAWDQVLDQASPGRVAAVALSLAAVEALIGHTDRARLLLHQAKDQGVAEAVDYAALLEPDATIRAGACDRLRALTENTDTLNFLGVAAHAATRLDEAHDLWARSRDAGDLAAPLLLQLSGLV